MSWVVGLLDALVKLPKGVIIVEKLVNIIIMWWVSRQTKETLKVVADAAALAAKAKTKEERHAALDAWRAALARPRHSA